MKRLIATFILAFLLLPMLPTATAQETPLGLSLFDPIQLPDRDRSIHGVRLTLIYGRHHDLHGADIGGLILPFAVNHLTGELRGAQFGLANWVDGDVYGSQVGGLNRIGGRGTGFQGGFVNISEGSRHFLGQWGLVNVTTGFHEGFQAGFVNHAGRVKGAQVGLVNHARELDGLQAGLLNIRSRPGIDMPSSSPVVFPLVSWSF